jgi:uncharacterized protein YjbI with pentapeptide repeats
MSPQVTAAIIAASVGALTLIATVVTQYLGRRATKGDLEEQRRQLDRTLAEQRARTLNERFATAADRLAADRPATVRLAGVYAMAGLADDWKENRQTCVDVLCGYLRMPYDPDPGEGDSRRLAFVADREVRLTVIRVIAAHLKGDAKPSWQGLNFDFTGVVFDGGDFSYAKFSGGQVSFNQAKFIDGWFYFGGAEFSGGKVDFSGAQFSGGPVVFDAAKFSGGAVDFQGAEFSGGDVFFTGANFSGGAVNFGSAHFSASEVVFLSAEFSGGEVDFPGAQFSGGRVAFPRAEFSGGEVDFTLAVFSGGLVAFNRAVFSGGRVDFADAVFSGSRVDFADAVFSGSEVDFSEADDWSCPPNFSWLDTPPPGVTLPSKEDQSRAQESAD